MDDGRWTKKPKGKRIEGSGVMDEGRIGQKG